MPHDFLYLVYIACIGVAVGILAGSPHGKRSTESKQRDESIMATRDSD
jgi:hypothetical protein